MAGDLPLRWHVEGFGPELSVAERVAAAAAESARGAARGGGAWPPAGFSIVKDRPMRVVLRGTLEREAPGPKQGRAVYVKARRAGMARRTWRRPRSPAEGRVLLRLRERGVAVPEVLGWSARPSLLDAGPDAGSLSGASSAPTAVSGRAIDVLVLAAVAGAVDLNAWASEPRTRAERHRVAQEVGRLLRRAHDAGWSDRDLHRGNLLVAPQGVVLVDAGTRIRARPLSRSRRVAALAVAAHGLSADPRSGLAALRAYADGDRAEARRWLAAVAPAAKLVARSYRRGRARRPTRSGVHFEVFRPDGGGVAVRSKDSTAPSIRDEVPALLSGAPHALGAPGARPLKDDGSVVSFLLPGVALVGRGPREVVAKRYAAAFRDRFRAPRALRAFRRAYALRIRGVACPEPLLAAVDATGAGVYVAAHAGRAGALCLDLDAALRAPARESAAPGRSAFAALPPRERKATLHRLGRFLRRMHDAEVSHRDLKAPNLVAWRDAEGARRVHFTIVDLEGARARRRPIAWWRRAHDLARLDASAGPAVSRADRLRVLRGYLAAFERAPVSLDDLAALVKRASDRKRARLRAASRGPR